MKRIQELMSLKGRVALITGGAGHIGSALAEALAEIGADIVILDVSLESCSQICKQNTKDHNVDALP